MPTQTRETPSLWLPITLQILLSVTGFWTLWGFPYNNGLLKILGHQTEPGALIPGPTAAPMLQKYTGIGPVDKQVTVLVSFFYTAIDGNRGDLSLAFFGLGGAVLAAWVLITIESLRHGNKNSWILISTTVFGLAIAIVGFACVAPLWFAYHLYTSPTVFNPPVYQLTADQPLQLAIAPLAVILGFGLPSVIMCLPAPAILSFETKQYWTGIQQGWSIWITLAQLLLTILVSFFNPDTGIASENDKKPNNLKYLRRAYAFALTSGASAHLVFKFFTLLAYAFPVLFAVPYNAQLLPSNVNSLTNPFSDIQAQTLGDGALWFLQWDTIVGVISVAIWGLTIRLAAKQEAITASQWFWGFVQIALVSFVVGPAGAAVVSIWGRDELVFRKAAAEKESKSG